MLFLGSSVFGQDLQIESSNGRFTMFVDGEELYSFESNNFTQEYDVQIKVELSLLVKTKFYCFWSY